MPVSKLESLPSSIANSAQLYSIINYLILLSQKANKQKLDHSSKLSQIEGYGDFAQANLFISKDNLVSEIEDIKDGINNILKTSKAVVITLSDYPDDGLKNKLVKWFREIDPFCLVDFLVDQNIIGGFALRTETKKYDCTYRNQLNITTDKFDRIINSV